jgi:hypothetical protein
LAINNMFPMKFIHSQRLLDLGTDF